MLAVVHTYIVPTSSSGSRPIGRGGIRVHESCRPPLNVFGNFLVGTSNYISIDHGAIKPELNCAPNMNYLARIPAKRAEVRVYKSPHNLTRSSTLHQRTRPTKTYGVKWCHKLSAVDDFTCGGPVLPGGLFTLVSAISLAERKGNRIAGSNIGRSAAQTRLLGARRGKAPPGDRRTLHRMCCVQDLFPFDATHEKSGITI